MMMEIFLQIMKTQFCIEIILGETYMKKNLLINFFYENYNESSDVPFHYRVGRARCEKKLASDCVIRFTILEYGVKSNMVTSLRGSSVVFCLMISGDEIR